MCKIGASVTDFQAKNQSKPDSMILTNPLQVPSKEAVEIAARIMANRAVRELELKQQKTPNQKDNTEQA